ncbi:MAG: serpin family protein [Candidatus Ancaeobacter aquaticus]|nr:serpin family protein [Candidatus Ancaeobacter aquaticus]
MKKIMNRPMHSRVMYVTAGILCALMVMYALAASPVICAQENDDVYAVAKSTNVFASELFYWLSPDEGNLFFSPYGISSALAMTYAGARGNTAVQMARVLAFTLPPEKLDPAMLELMGMLHAMDNGYQLFVANALWAQTGYAFRPEFLTVIDKYYSAGFKEVDYNDATEREQTRQKINTWTAENTGNKIIELIKPKVLDEGTRLVLTNAIYFKGMWRFPFKAKSTEEDSFNVSPQEPPVRVPMMHQTGKFKYAEDQDVQILEMPYAGGGLAMVIVLPRSFTKMRDVRDALSRDLDSRLARLSARKVQVSLPRFKVEKECILNEPLIELGMVYAFDARSADFSGMTSDPAGLYISKVIHKAFIEVNEEGAEAAAAAAVLMNVSARSSVRQTPTIFVADRPFFFLIRDTRTGAVLFMGRLSDPRQEF